MRHYVLHTFCVAVLSADPFLAPSFRDITPKGLCILTNFRILLVLEGKAMSLALAGEINDGHTWRTARA